jgi:hypothetical protein
MAESLCGTAHAGRRGNTRRRAEDRLRSLIDDELEAALLSLLGLI